MDCNYQSLPLVLVLVRVHSTTPILPFLLFHHILLVPSYFIFVQPRLQKLDFLYVLSHTSITSVISARRSISFPPSPLFIYMDMCVYVCMLSLSTRHLTPTSKFHSSVIILPPSFISSRSFIPSPSLYFTSQFFLLPIYTERKSLRLCRQYIPFYVPHIYSFTPSFTSSNSFLFLSSFKSPRSKEKKDLSISTTA